MTILILSAPDAPDISGISDAAPNVIRGERHRLDTRHIPWGLYQIYWNPKQYGQQLDARLGKFATKPDFVMFYRDLLRPFPAKAVDAIRDRGAAPIISLELWNWHDPKRRALPDINAGAYDDFFTQWARRAAQGKGKGKGQGRVLLRFGFEFNGEWFSWSQDPAAFVAAWRRVHDIFRREGATNVEWVWCPNVMSVPKTPANNMHLYYPGDAYVDWVGVDGYNWGVNHDQWHTWQSCRETFADVLDDFAHRYPNRPVMIAEFASVEGKQLRKAAWIRDAHTWLVAQPTVKAVVWFDYDKRREGEHNWRIDSSLEALAAFNETFAAPAPAPERGL